MAKKKYTEIGTIRNGDYGFYFKVNQDVNLKEGESLSLQKPTDKFDRFLEGGHITQEEYDESIGKIPDFIKYNVILAR